MLKRAIWTWYTVAEELALHWIPHYKDWRLNEKHYGAL
jgi:2,3-bisphosphoglycerate-dependent phosphoglycerate mutase